MVGSLLAMIYASKPFATATLTNLDLGFLPGKPVAWNFGLLWIYYGLLYGIVACSFGLLGVPGIDRSCRKHLIAVQDTESGIS